MPEPNLFIIGASKAGTTSLCACLDAHPEVLMSGFKEPGYFLGPTDPRRDKPSQSDRYRNSNDNYTALFSSVGTHSYYGEATTAYTWQPRFEGVAERIARHNPDARLIYLMRDPIERTISHYWWNVRFEGETRDMLTAITEDKFYRDVSHYAMQLRVYLDYFPRRNIMPLTLEQFQLDPGGTVTDLFDWLGLDPSFLPDSFNHHSNPTPREVVQSRGRPLLSKFQYSGFWNAFGPFVPQTIRSIGRNLVERTVDRAAISTEHVCAFLRPIQREQTLALSELLGESFQWTTLKLADNQSSARTVGSKALSGQ